MERGCTRARSVDRNTPKKGYDERYDLETDFFDRFVYQAICSFFIPLYDPLLGHRVLSYRYEPVPLDAKYLFKNKNAIATLDRAMARKGYDHYRYVDDIRVIADSELARKASISDFAERDAPAVAPGGTAF